MSEISFQIVGADPLHHAAVPTLAFKLEVTNGDLEETIHSIALNCQVQLEVTRRNYTPGEKQKLADLFGDPSRWGQTLRPMLWTHVQTVVPTFSGKTCVDLNTQCSFDFTVAATKYFYGVESGDIPLCVMFSGTVFQTDETGTIRVSPIPWDREARFRLPVQTWREMMDLHYPNTAWVCLQRDVFDRVYEYKVQNGIPTWEMALDRMLAEVRKAVLV